MRVGCYKKLSLMTEIECLINTLYRGVTLSMAVKSKFNLVSSALKREVQREREREREERVKSKMYQNNDSNVGYIVFGTAEMNQMILPMSLQNCGCLGRKMLIIKREEKKGPRVMT